MLRTLLVPILMIGLFVSWFDSSHCLYEDQIHKWDWRQRFIGIDVDNCLRSNRESKELLFCVTSETNVVSAINRKGEIAWRNVQEEQGKIIGSALSSTAEGLITVSLYKTRNESKLFLRKWSQDDFGYLIVEKNHFLQGSKNGDAVNCLVSIDPVKSLVNVVCGESSSQLKSFQFSLSKDDSDSKPVESDHSSLEASPSDVDLERDCRTVGLKNIICLTRFSLHHIKLGESKWSSQNLPEAASSGGKYILERVTNQNGGDSNYFGLRTVADKDNTESFHLYKLNIGSNGDGALKWQTAFPNIQKVSTLSGESDEQFFGIALTKDGVEVFKIGSDWKLEKLFSSLIDTTSHANGVHRFSCIKFGSQIEFIVTFDDQRVVSYNLKGKVNWSREESLSSIIWSQFISLPYFSSSTSSKNDNFELPNDFAFLANFLNRLYSQVSSIQEYIISSYGTFFTSEASRLAAIKDESKEKSLVSDVFGFHKLLFIVTERGKLFVLDNVRKGKIIWSHYDPRLKEDIIKETKLIDSIEMKRARKCDKLPVLSVHLQRNNLFSPLVTIVSPLGYLISYNPLEGRVETTLDLDMKIKLSMLMYHADDQGVKGLILMNENDQVTFYPKSSRDTFLLHKDAYYMMVSKQTSEQVSGYSLRHLKHDPSSDTNGDVARQVWSLNLPPLTGSCLQVRWKEVDEHVHSQGKVLADRAVLYKYLNPNLVALVNRGEESSEEGRINVVQFYLIDAVTGSIYYSVVHRRASDPVHLVHSENFIIYSFYNEKQRRIEISSLELFEGKEMPPPPPVRTPPKIIEHLSFIFPTGIRAMRETQTIRGITNKHILIALTSGGILSLPKIFLDPRRASFANSKYASSAAAMEEGGVYLPPYIPELPIPSEGIINYNQSVIDVNRIYVGVSSLESTSLLFITGLDIYYTRVTPSKTFDILKDDFDHLLIIIVLTALLLLSIGTKYLASRKTLNAAWK